MKNGNKAPTKWLAFISLFFLAILLVIVFTNMSGNTLNQTNNSVNTWILENIQRLPKFHLSEQDKQIASMLPEYQSYAQKLEDLNVYMEDAIHVILFFLLGISMMILLPKSKSNRQIGNVIITLACGQFLNFFSEMYQNGISGRGYEERDVINNAIGIILAIIIYEIIYFTKLLIHKRRNKKQNKTIIIKYFSGGYYLK